MVYASNMDADQTAHSRSLVSGLAVRFIDSTIAIFRILRTLQLSRFKLVYAAELPSLSVSCSQTLQYVMGGFLCDFFLLFHTYK